MNRLPVVLGAFLLLFAACTDARQVNSALVQNTVTWFVFDGGEVSGLRPLPGFEQNVEVAWRPLNRALVPTSLGAAPSVPGAVAVSGLGVLLLDDRDGRLQAQRPGFLPDFSGYRAGRLFSWNGKLFVTLYQDPVGSAPPISLAWWEPGQSRFAVYPLPSQVADPVRQLVDVVPPRVGESGLFLVWKTKGGREWEFPSTVLDLASGQEVDGAMVVPPPQATDDEFGVVMQRLVERWGTGVQARLFRGPDTVVALTESGWVAVSRLGDDKARLYHLPDLGGAGRYLDGFALDKGYVLTWAVSYRGHGGASGLVHLPFAVLAP